MNAQEKKLVLKAKKVLGRNWRKGHTVPSPGLYPHQWSWDSAFTSIGYSHINQARAQKELLSLFTGQWKNGMLPHIIFRAKGNYFPNAEYWNTELSGNAPEVETSGITQPPVHAVAALSIYNNAKDRKKAGAFLKEIFPKLLAFHNYLLTERDPEKSGLATILHPWESGLDNSARWDDPLAGVKPRDLPHYKRIDDKKVNAKERPTKAAYDRFIYLVEIMKKHSYGPKMYNEMPFRVKDVIFNSILFVANKSLAEIAGIVREDDGEIKKWLARAKKNYSRYFFCRDIDCLAYDFDLVSKKRIEKKTIASLMPLYTGLLSKKKAGDTIAFMKHAHVCKENCRHNHPVATSIAIDAAEFNPLNYWRGPIWININWMLYRGLLGYGFSEDAGNLRKAIIDLIAEHGFREYYNPLSGDGLGAKNFSWTAALLIDLLLEKEKK